MTTAEKLENIITEIGEWELNEICIRHKGCEAYQTDLDNKGGIVCKCGTALPKTTLVYFMMTAPERIWDGVKI